MPTIAIGRLYILALIMFCCSVWRDDLLVILFSVLVTFNMFLAVYQQSMLVPVSKSRKCDIREDNYTFKLHAEYSINKLYKSLIVTLRGFLLQDFPDLSRFIIMFQ